MVTLELLLIELKFTSLEELFTFIWLSSLEEFSIEFYTLVKLSKLVEFD